MRSSDSLNQSSCHCFILPNVSTRADFSTFHFCSTFPSSGQFILAHPNTPSMYTCLRLSHVLLPLATNVCRIKSHSFLLCLGLCTFPVQSDLDTQKLVVSITFCPSFDGYIQTQLPISLLYHDVVYAVPLLGYWILPSRQGCFSSTHHTQTTCSPASLSHSCHTFSFLKSTFLSSPL